ncbi:hypothetical protein DPSP01_011997 [Paraphaeosphaeria sporulosa]
MPPLPSPALSILTDDLRTLLAPTPYACTSLTQLPGGTTSFVFLGVLATPLVLTPPSGAQRTEERVIVKHAAPFASCHTEFLVDAGRVAYEAAMLGALSGFHGVKLPEDKNRGEGADVQVPEVYFYDDRARVLVIQYIPSAAPLHTALESLSSAEADCMGRALGTWLKRFHTWCEEQAGLKEVLGGNEEEVKLKWKLTWVQGTGVLDRLGDVVGEEERGAWYAARDRVWQEKQSPGVLQRGVVHGDFWVGNILMPTPLPNPDETRSLQLHVIDFEFSHLAPLSTDLSSFLGSLLEIYYISPSPLTSIEPLLTAFLAGYGSFSEDMKWRTLIQTGVFVVNWWSRGPPGRGDVDAETRRRGRELVRMGVRWVKGGWERDHTVFKGTQLERIATQGAMDEVAIKVIDVIDE